MDSNCATTSLITDDQDSDGSIRLGLLDAPGEPKQPTLSATSTKSKTNKPNRNKTKTCPNPVTIINAVDYDKMPPYSTQPRSRSRNQTLLAKRKSDDTKMHSPSPQRRLVDTTPDHPVIDSLSDGDTTYVMASELDSHIQLDTTQLLPPCPADNSLLKVPLATYLSAADHVDTLLAHYPQIPDDTSPPYQNAPQTELTTSPIAQCRMDTSTVVDVLIQSPDVTDRHLDVMRPPMPPRPAPAMHHSSPLKNSLPHTSLHNAGLSDSEADVMMRDLNHAPPVFITVLMIAMKTDDDLRKLPTAKIHKHVTRHLKHKSSYMSTPMGHLAVTVSSYDDEDTLNLFTTIGKIPVYVRSVSGPLKDTQKKFSSTSSTAQMNTDSSPVLSSSSKRHPHALPNQSLPMMSSASSDVTDSNAVCNQQRVDTQSMDSLPSCFSKTLRPKSPDYARPTIKSVMTQHNAELLFHNPELHMECSSPVSNRVTDDCPMMIADDPPSSPQSVEDTPPVVTQFPVILQPVDPNCSFKPLRSDKIWAELLPMIFFLYPN